MAYEAKVKDTSTLRIVQFAGIHEFVRYEWRPLPDDKYETARGNPHLEAREVKAQPKEESILLPGKADEFLEAGSADEILTESEPEPKPKANKRRKRKK